jgi:hypothetical protein
MSIRADTTLARVVVDKRVPASYMMAMVEAIRTVLHRTSEIDATTAIASALTVMPIIGVVVALAIR